MGGLGKPDHLYNHQQQEKVRGEQMKQNRASSKKKKAHKMIFQASENKLATKQLFTTARLKMGAKLEALALCAFQTYSRTSSCEKLTFLLMYNDADREDKCSTGIKAEIIWHTTSVDITKAKT